MALRVALEIGQWLKGLPILRRQVVELEGGHAPHIISVRLAKGLDERRLFIGRHRGSYYAEPEPGAADQTIGGLSVARHSQPVKRHSL